MAALQILLHTSYEFPSAGTGVYAANTQGAQMSLAVTAELTRSSESIRSLSVESRNCVFPDENKLRIHHVYTQSSCLTECRLLHILLMCSCKLYFFELPGITFLYLRHSMFSFPKCCVISKSVWFCMF